MLIKRIDDNTLNLVQLILQWPLAEIYQPSSGENELDKVQGVVINPFDEHPELVDWAYFEDDSK